ncbi:deoxyribose-phosphate aldolase [Sanguibacter suarezii]|uniref:deoxyribose-phosphate aldolase n=1 Tax=Sanguibacter suarezii TaxID=60921 RepID=UPI000A057E69|nr:deoxyribose-phosphate aldolase [Sanguibacter suarezii]
MSHPHLTADELAARVDHTLLKPESTPADVAALAEEATELGTYSICVSPSMLPLALPAGSSVKIATVCGFPSGKHHSQIKAAEAAHAVADGAHEVDMVINLGAVKAGEWEDVQADIAAVRAAAPHPTVLKVIIESAALTDDEIVAACRASEGAGADFVKTSTGFHPAGGASVHAVELMAATVGDRLGIKASGGIRTAADALAMIEAGATRLGLSGTAAVLAGLDDVDEQVIDQVDAQRPPEGGDAGY